MPVRALKLCLYAQSHRPNIGGKTKNARKGIETVVALLPFAADCLGGKTKNARKGIETCSRSFRSAVVPSPCGKTKNARKGIETLFLFQSVNEPCQGGKTKNARKGIETLKMRLKKSIPSMWKNKECP